MPPKPYQPYGEPILCINESCWGYFVLARNLWFCPKWAIIPKKKIISNLPICKILAWHIAVTTHTSVTPPSLSCNKKWLGITVYRSSWILLQSFISELWFRLLHHWHINIIILKNKSYSRHGNWKGPNADGWRDSKKRFQDRMVE